MLVVVVVVVAAAVIMVVGSGGDTGGRVVEGGGCGGGGGGGGGDGGGSGDRNGSEVYVDEMPSCRDLFQYILPSKSRSPKGLSVFLLQFLSARNCI